MAASGDDLPMILFIAGVAIAILASAAFALWIVSAYQ